MSTVRVTLTVPEEVLTQLDRMAKFLSVSRSSVVVGMLMPGLDQVSKLLDSLSELDPHDLNGQGLQRAAYDRLAQVELLLQGVKDDVAKLQ